MRGVCSQQASSRRWVKLWAMRLKHRTTQHHSWKRLPAGREVRGELAGQVVQRTEEHSQAELGPKWGGALQLYSMSLQC